MFDFGRTTSFPFTRPMRTSVLSNVVVVDGPSFSVMVTLSIGAPLNCEQIRAVGTQKNIRTILLSMPVGVKNPVMGVEIRVGEVSPCAPISCARFLPRRTRYGATPSAGGRSPPATPPNRHILFRFLYEAGTFTSGGHSVASKQYLSFSTNTYSRPSNRRTPRVTHTWGMSFLWYTWSI